MTVGLIAREVHPVNCVFNAGTGPNLLPGDFFDAELLTIIQTNNRPALKNASSQKVSIVAANTLHVRM